MRHIPVASLPLLLCTLLASTAAAQEGPPPEDDLLSVDVHAFVSQGFILTTHNDYLAPDTTDGSFQLSEVGINFTKQLGDHFRVGVQLFAQNFLPGGNYDALVDWFYLDYRFTNWLGLRAGRIKLPFGFYNEFNDIDAGRLPILLPQSTYPLQARQFLFALTGLEVYGFARLGAAGALDYRLYAGTIFLDAERLVPAGSMLEFSFEVPYVVGGRLFWETPLEGLRVGGSVLAVALDTTVFVAGMPMPIAIENRSLLAMGSVEYGISNLIVRAEYSRWHADQESVIADSNLSVTSERAYALLAYRFAPLFQAGAYYALYFPDVDQREGRANQQHDVALTLRFDLNEHWLLKLEGHYMNGTAGLVGPLQLGPPPVAEERSWAVFLAKTTAYF